MRKPTLQLLGFATVMLLMTTTKIVVRAQQTVLLNASDPTTAMNASNVARMLADVFGNLSGNFGTIGGPGSAPAGAKAGTPPPSHSGNAHSLNITLGPDLMRYLNLTTNGLPQSAIDALLGALANQDPATLKNLQQSASTVAGFLNLPTSFGDGTNIKNFIARVDQLRALRDAVRNFLSVTEIQTITGYLITAEQLALQAVAAFPLAALAFVVANLALGAAIVGLVAGIMYIVGSATALAAAIPAPVTVVGTGGRSSESEAPSYMDIPVFADLKNQSQIFLKRVLPFALDPNNTGLINIADTLLRSTNDMLTLLTPPQLNSIQPPGAYNPFNLFGDNPFNLLTRLG